MSERLHALTIWQPWATLIMEGCKPYEYRGWPAPRAFVGQRIVIHAGARPIRRREVADLFYRIEKDPDGTGLVIGPALDILDRWWRGGVTLPLAAGLGTALLGAPRKATEIHAGVMDSDRIDHSMWGWPLTDIRRFAHPVPCRGAQGFWPWPADLAREAAA